MLTISTGRSWGAFLYGIIEIFVSSAVTYCDQASWQSRIAAKPVQGVWGFLLAGFIWFSIPNVMAVTTGMAYLALSSNNGSHLLMPSEIDEGQHPPFLSLPPVLPSVLTFQFHFLSHFLSLLTFLKVCTFCLLCVCVCQSDRKEKKGEKINVTGKG